MTADLWWGLPGARRFIAGVIEQLEDGKNVVLALPEHLPAGCGRALVRSTTPRPGRAWQSFGLRADSRQQPIDVLYRHFAPSSRPDTVRTAGALVREPEFARRLIWLEGIPPAAWPCWRSFLEEYEHACRTLSAEQRSLFCVSAVGINATATPHPGVCLAVIPWRNVVSELDMLLYTSLVFPERPLTGIRRKVAISVIASLAVWDPAVSDLLARQEIRTILDPGDLLRRLASERGWLSPGVQDGWALGYEDLVADQQRQHSAFLAQHNRHTEINSRIWMGQVSVLYPLLEVRRQQLLAELRDLLWLPFRTKDGAVIEQLYDLELGHIELQLVERQRAGWQDPRLAAKLPVVSKLKKIRNSLAHFTALSEHELDL